MAGKVSLQGFVATHRDSGTGGGGSNSGWGEGQDRQGPFPLPACEAREQLDLGMCFLWVPA